MTISDQLLLAYIDGELSREDRARVDAAVKSDPQVADRLRRHQSLAARIHGAFAPVAEEAAPEHLLRMVKPAAPVVSLQAARAKKADSERKAKPPAARPGIAAFNGRWAAIAAALVAGIGIGVFSPRPHTGMIDGEMRASGILAVALDSKLASQPDKDGPVRIGLTFRDTDGRWCRTFTARDGLAGVACRQREAWAVRMAQTGAPTDAADFRQASSASAALAAAVEGLIAGEPADAEAERRALASGWR